jgi:hypothetical protein
MSAWIVCADGGPTRSQFVCHQHDVAEGRRQEIAPFLTLWSEDADGTVSLRESTFVQQLDTGAPLVQLDMNMECLENIMAFVRLGPAASLHLTSNEPVERTVKYLTQNMPQLTHSLKTQVEDNAQRPHPHTLALRTALAMEREETARVLGATCDQAQPPPPSRKRVRDTADQGEQVLSANMQQVDVTPQIMEQRIRQHCGPIKPPPAHATRLRELNQMQYEKVTQILTALYNTILQPLTYTCAGHVTVPTALNFVVAKRFNDFMPGIFTQNKSCAELFSEETCAKEEICMCSGITVSEVVYGDELRLSGTHSVPHIAVHGDIVCDGSKESLFAFLNNNKEQVRSFLKRHFDAVVFKSNTTSLSNIRGGHALLKPFALCLSWKRESTN